MKKLPKEVLQINDEYTQDMGDVDASYFLHWLYDNRYEIRRKDESISLNYPCNNCETSSVNWKTGCLNECT